MGVMTQDATQLVFLDTPGKHRPRTRLGDFMVKSIGEAVSGVDAAMLVVEPRPAVHENERQLLEQFRKNKLPALLVINKIEMCIRDSHRGHYRGGKGRNPGIRER